MTRIATFALAAAIAASTSLVALTGPALADYQGGEPHHDWQPRHHDRRGNDGWRGNDDRRFFAQPRFFDRQPQVRLPFFFFRQHRNFDGNGYND